MASEVHFSGGQLVDPRSGSQLSVISTDEILIPATQMYSNGTLLNGTGAADTGFPRWSLADAATQRTKFVVRIPVDWDAIVVVAYWANESAVAGNAKFNFAHAQVGFAGTLDGAVTTLNPAATASLGQRSLNALDFGTIDIAKGFFGDYPFLQGSVIRLGSDASDTINGGAVSVAGVILNRA